VELLEHPVEGDELLDVEVALQLALQLLGRQRQQRVDVEVGEVEVDGVSVLASDLGHSDA
jgi:hypothetical protein